MTHLKEPVVGSSAGLELQGAQRVSDILQGIHQAVGVVIAGVDAPGVAGMRVLCKLDSVCYQIPHHRYIILMVTSHPVHHKTGHRCTAHAISCLL